jgi:hypothetical protein
VVLTLQTLDQSSLEYGLRFLSGTCIFGVSCTGEFFFAPEKGPAASMPAAPSIMNSRLFTNTHPH